MAWTLTKNLVQLPAWHDTLLAVNVNPDRDGEELTVPTWVQPPGTTLSASDAASGSESESGVSSTSLPNGTCVGDYRILGEISSGGFGTVYRAEHVERGTTVAVKVLHADLISNSSNILRFEREVDVIRRLRHPNVVEILDYGQVAEGRPFFAMELLSGETLDQYLARRGRLPFEEMMSILEPLASALDMAHDQFIIHRDIKASNVFLSDENGSRRVVLLDFGIAKLLDSQDPALTASRQIIGTLRCMAPEQRLGLPIDARTDIYSLGILAYTMITGKVPFDVGGSDTLNSLAFLYARPQVPSQCARVDSAVDAPILRTLAHDPFYRPASAGEFVDELRSAMQTARLAEARPDGAADRQGIAVHVEVRLDPSILEEPDELLLMDLESILPLVSSALWEAGLLPVMETGNNLLTVAACPDDPIVSLPFRKRVVETVIQARERLEQRPGRDTRIAITFVVITGVLVVNEDGALLGGGLLDPASWLPAFSSDGVLLSNSLAESVSAAGRNAADTLGFVLVTDL